MVDCSDSAISQAYEDIRKVGGINWVLIGYDGNKTLKVSWISF